MKLAQGLLTACWLAAAVSGALAPAARAQGGGFTAHDIYYAGYQGGSPSDGLVRVDPVSGNSAVLKKFTAISGGQESMAFDPYRQRLILMARLNPADGILWRPYLADASGNFAPLDPPVAAWNGFAPTGDGRIYFRESFTTVSPIRWLDAANQIHVLYDTDGVTPYAMEGFSSWLDDMIYVATENALIVVTSAPNTPCPGGNGPRLHVRKLPLTTDGTRLSGPVSCAEFDMDPWDSETSHGLSLMSDGDLLLGAHSGHYGAPQLPRLVRVNTATLAMSAFANFGDASNGGSTWSTALGKGIAQSHFTGVLKAYSAGQVDAGVNVPSTASFPSTRCALDEIPLLACDGGWIAYGAGLSGKGAFVPRLYGQDCPAPGKTITLRLDQAVGGSNAMLWAGLAPASAPFKGGTFRVGALLVSVPLAVGGTPGLAGAGSLALPVALPSDAALSSLSVFLQAGFQDAAAVQGVSLTQGMEMEIG